MFGRRPGKNLMKDRLRLEDSLEMYQDQIATLNDHYMDQMMRYEQYLENGNTDAAEMMLKGAESTQKMYLQAVAQYTEVYNKIGDNSEISKRDGDKKNASIGTAIGVGTAIGSLTLGALSLSQCVETDRKGLLTNKNVKRFFEQINPLQILRRH